jgi:IgA peptidase M64/Big-like domain-containing protein
MPRFRLPAFPSVCVLIAALCGCGGQESAPLTTASATLTPTGAAPAAEAAAVVTVEDQGVQARLRATDADGDALTFSIANAPDHAVVTLDPASGAFHLQPVANYFGADSFEYSVSDGHGNTAHARIDLTVQPLPDPPVIDASATTSVLAAGRDAQLRFAITDPDGDPVTLSVSQVPGTETLLNLRATDQEVRFLAPDVSAATAVEVVVEARDSTGRSTRARHVVTLSPVSATGKLFTVLGTPQSDGLHWVITGDGFTADQQQDLLRASLAMAHGLASTPELALHSGVLNVHVLTAVSRDSGVATVGAGRAPRTAFDATLGCTDVERVACVNWDKVYAALLTENAPFDEIAVVINTTLYVGNTSGSGLIVSRNFYAPLIMLHEMGHVFAGLGDEYVDKNVTDAFVFPYREGQFPNVTTETDPARIPWRHWFADPAHIPVAMGESGVGRFEGAFYAPHGYYRPKQDSNMRTLEAPVGEVNAEAWLRAFYRAAPPISAAYPEPGVVPGLAGTDVEFEIVSPWSPELMTVRWFVDGNEIEQARGRYVYTLHADGGQHEVQATIEDCTGRIRAPGAREHAGTATWSVSNEPGIAASKALTPPARIGRWIRMRVDSSGHSVLGITADDARHARMPGASGDSGFEYELFDARGATLAAGKVADPRVIRGPLAPPGAPAMGHATRRLPSGNYLIGIPEGVDARRLKVRRLDGSMEKAATTEQWLDL